MWRSNGSGGRSAPVVRVGPSPLWPIDQALAESVASYSARIDESMDTFLPVLGHDLRGPLASLSNCVQLRSGAGQAPEARDRVLHIATRSIASMVEMITDLLE